MEIIDETFPGWAQSRASSAGGALTPTRDTMERVRLGTAPAAAPRIEGPGKVKTLSQGDNDFRRHALPPTNVGISWVPQYIKYKL